MHITKISKKKKRPYIFFKESKKYTKRFQREEREAGMLQLYYNLKSKTNFKKKLIHTHTHTTDIKDLLNICNGSEPFSLTYSERLEQPPVSLIILSNPEPAIPFQASCMGVHFKARRMDLGRGVMIHGAKWESPSRCREVGAAEQQCRTEVPLR